MNIWEKFKKSGFLNVVLTFLCFVFIGCLSGLYIKNDIVYTYLFLAGYCVLAMLFAFYAEKQGANRLMVVIISFLIATGVLVQNVIAPINPDISSLDDWVSKQFKIAMFAIAFIAVYMVGRYIILKKSKELWVALVGLAAIGVLAICCILPETRGAKNWISIGGMSLQLTEFVKFFGVVFMGELILLEVSDWLKFTYMTLFMAVCAFILMVVVSEMGTLIILALVYLVLVLNYIRIPLLKVIVSLGVILFIVVFALCFRAIDSVTCQWDCINGCQETIKVEKLDEKGNPLKDSDGNIIYDSITRTKIISGIECPDCSEKGIDTRRYYKDPTYTCQRCYYKKYDGTTPDKCPICSENAILRSKFGGAASKLYQRFAVFLSYDKCSEEDFAVQVKTGLKAAKLGGWFGADDDNRVAVILPHNDSVVVAIANRMGMIWVFIILICYYALFLSVRFLRSPVKVAVILALFVQMVVTYAGNFNFFARTGIGVPFISSGGTIYAVSLAFVYVLFTRDERFMREKIEIKEGKKDE